MRARDVRLDGGLRVQVGETGEGPVALLLHGLGAARDIWTYLAPALAPTWRVIAVDLPGHGASDKPDAPYSPSWYASVVRRVGAALGIDQAVVVGSSLGGRVALDLALADPAFVRALVLAGPAVGLAPWMPLVSRVARLLAAPSVLRRTMPRTLDRCFVDPTVPGAALRRDVLATRLAASDVAAFTRAVGRSFAALANAPALPLERITQPTLAVWGREDRLVRVRPGSAQIRRLPNARVQVLARCGHLPMLERPGDCNAMVEEFLRPYAKRVEAVAAGGR